MKHEAAILAYAQWFTDNERKHHEEHNPERLARLLAENPNALEDYRQTWIAKGEKLVGDIEYKTLDVVERISTGLLHPSNKASRALFSAVTGISLPATVKGTDEAVRGYCGKELDELAERRRAFAEAKQAADEAKERAAEAAKLEATRKAFEAFEFIDGEDFLSLSRSLGFEVHPRTAGTLIKRVHGVNRGRAVQFAGKQLPSGVCELIRKVAAAVTEPPEPEPTTEEIAAVQELFERPNTSRSACICNDTDSFCPQHNGQGVEVDDDGRQFWFRATGDNGPFRWFPVTVKGGKLQTASIYADEPAKLTPSQVVEVERRAKAEGLELLEAWHHPGTETERKEQKAFESVNTPAKLKARFADAVAVHTKAGVDFRKGSLNFEARRMVSACGLYSLTWSLRDNPDWPEAYDNQQTTVGVVRLHAIHASQSAQNCIGYKHATDEEYNAGSSHRCPACNETNYFRKPHNKLAKVLTCWACLSDIDNRTEREKRATMLSRAATT